jgi:hypothetical protein
MLSERSALTFSLKVLAILLVLSASVLVAAYCLVFVDPSHREGAATLVGAAATIFAGWLAWESLTFQAQRADRAKSLQAAVRKEDAVIALTQPIHAATALMAVIDRELSRVGDTVGASLRVKKSARHLDHVIDRDLLLWLMDELGADDRINLLIIIGTLRTVLAVSEFGTDTHLSADDFRTMKEALSRLETYLTAFDAELKNAFVRDIAGRNA